MSAENRMFSEETIIYSYTRARALADGVLIDVTGTAHEAGIRLPVAVTAGLWRRYIEPDELSWSLGQSVQGRLWDTLWLFRHAARNFSGSVLLYEVYFVLEGGRPVGCQVKAFCGPGDSGEPVITLMLPDED